MHSRLTPTRAALLYALFASLWILLSGHLLRLTVTDPLLLNRIEMIKGLVFVAVTSLLLYLLLEGGHKHEGGATSVSPSAIELPKALPLLLVLILLVLAVPALGVAVYELRVPQTISNTFQNLGAIAELKDQELEIWLAERRSDAQGLADSAVFAQLVQSLQSGNRHDAGLHAIKGELQSLQAGFDSVLIFTPEGRLLASLGDNSDIPRNLLQQALSGKQVLFSDLYRDAQGNINLDWIVPIIATIHHNHRAVAIAVLRVAPDKFLYPMIQTWPTSSGSGETLLVRPEGGDVLFLNELRFGKNIALSRRDKINNPDLLAAIAIRSNKPGTTIGLDYRQVPVLAAYRPVAGTGWHLIAKMDREEVLKPVRILVYWVSGVGCAAISMIMAMLAILLRQQQRNHQLALQARSIEVLRQSDVRFRAMAKSANVAIVTADSDGHIVDFNPGAEKLFGYPEAEITGQPVTILMPERYRDPHRAGMARVVAGGETRVMGKTVELAGLHKDGGEIPLEMSLAQWKITGGHYFTAILRDMTERNRDRDRILRMTRYYAALSHCNEAIVRNNSLEEIFQAVCRSIVGIGGIKMAWIGLLDDTGKWVKPVASYGAITEFLEDIRLSVDAHDPVGRVPTGAAIRENRPYWCQDYLHDPNTAPLRDRGLQFGVMSSAALPLKRNGVPVGNLSIYADAIDAFDVQSQHLLSEMAMDISFALDNFDRDTKRVLSEQELADSEQRFRGLVEQSVAGILIIQDNKLSYVNPRCAEIIGQGSVDELIGRDPLYFVVEADRGKVAESISRLIHKEVPSIALDFGVEHKDGYTVMVGANANLASYHGRPAIISLIQDISEKKRAEARIVKYIEQIKATFLSTVQLATSLSEMRDPYTAGHERRVAEIAVAIAAEMGLDEQRIEGIRIAGYLHDIGKISIPAEILVKPGRLTATEYALVQGHAHAGYDVLKHVDFPWPVATVALQHHERIDGSGYPNKLKGEQILLESRIMAVADVVEAMASHRPYRAGLGIDKALAEIERGRGTAYDPDAADACLRLFREKGFELPPY